MKEKVNLIVATGILSSQNNRMDFIIVNCLHHKL